MPPRIIRKRARFFIAIEGESEQSFIKWLQMLSENQLNIHLDTVVLGGGGYKSMLKKAVREHRRRCKTSGHYKDRFLVVDGDRAEQGDWSIEELRHEAAKNKIIVCVQNPNHEGLLFRMMSGEIPDSTSASAKLKSRWPNYKKPMNAGELERQFSLDDLLRVASVDSDLETLLKRIELC